MALRAREIRERLQGKVDPNISRILEALAEEQSVVRQQLVLLAQDIDRMASIMQNFVAVAENMKTTVERLKGMRGNDAIDVGADTDG